MVDFDWFGMHCPYLVFVALISFGFSSQETLHYILICAFIGNICTYVYDENPNVNIEQEGSLIIKAKVQLWPLIFQKVAILAP